jgi:hypothetical protein
MKNEEINWKPEFGKIGRFYFFTEMEGEKQGNNTIKMIHHWADKMNLHRPGGIALRLIIVPPNGSIPAHTHDTDNGSSWLVCIAGSGVHWVEIGGRRTEHGVRGGGWTVSTQKMRGDLGSLSYVHGFDASDEGVILLSIYNESELSDEALRDIQMGAQVPKNIKKKAKARK